MQFCCFGASNMFLVGENLRKQVLSKKLNAAHSQKRKTNSRSTKL